MYSPSDCKSRLAEACRTVSRPDGCGCRSRARLRVTPRYLAVLVKRRAVRRYQSGEKDGDYFSVCRDGAKDSAGNRFERGLYNGMLPYPDVASYGSGISVERYVAAHHQHSHEYRQHADDLLDSFPTKLGGGSISSSPPCVPCITQFAPLSLPRGFSRQGRIAAGDCSNREGGCK
jgi:hypothetical protein